MRDYRQLVYDIEEFCRTRLDDLEDTTSEYHDGYTDGLSDILDIIYPERIVD
jgi:hypothetical protein